MEFKPGLSGAWASDSHLGRHDDPDGSGPEHRDPIYHTDGDDIFHDDLHGDGHADSYLHGDVQPDDFGYAHRYALVHADNHGYGNLYSDQCFDSYPHFDRNADGHVYFRMDGYEDLDPDGYAYGD